MANRQRKARGSRNPWPRISTDGFSRYIVNWDIRESMTEADIEIILQGAKEKYPEARPRIISDNGPQFIAKDFKEFIRISGMTHVRTSPFYPQSNGKSNTGTNRSKGSASGRERRCRSMMRADWCRVTLTTTTTSV
jgi:transposase InsO family protein